MDVVTPVQVESRLRALGKELDEAHEKQESAEFLYVHRKIAYDLASARARTQLRDRCLERGTKITVSELEDMALLACEPEYTEWNIAEATVKVARANVSRLRTQVDIARSVGTTVRASLDIS